MKINKRNSEERLSHHHDTLTLQPKTFDREKKYTSMLQIKSAEIEILQGTPTFSQSPIISMLINQHTSQILSFA